MKKYKFNRSDFKPLPVILEHMDLLFRFMDKKVDVCSTIHITARKPLTEIRLDAQELTIHSVEWIARDAGEILKTEAVSLDQPASAGQALEYNYLQNENSLIVTMPHEVKEGEQFAVRIKNTCIPTENILDGLYMDTTPPGAPQQYMSQCQQWGFQRITPVFDDCTAKCTFRTTIEANARYTHMISNGNISAETNPDGTPVPLPDNPARRTITYENDIPIAPYLFFLSVGTWDVLEDEFTYPSGKQVKLEYLVPPGRLEGARIPMDILKKSILWQGEAEEYEYHYDVYRTICMEKSNFGGMENVGNTTIVTSAALIDENTGDARLHYAHGVIVHEFEHNQCGSDVTMETPFDMWLNEAFTVDVEQRFMNTLFDPACERLDRVNSIRSPIGGPLAIEDAGHQGKIVREGFNNPDELVDGLTYVKAAEVIRMLRLLIGEEPFRKAKNHYFKTFFGKNANTDDFFSCFEQITGRDLSQFRREWLHTIGYPCVEATWNYEPATKKLNITIKQSRTGEGGLFHFPIALAAVDRAGNDISQTAQVIEITGAVKELSFDNVPEPSFISFNRDYSFYGTFNDLSSCRDQLVAQVRSDPNMFNRVEAMRHVTDIEFVKLIKDINNEPDPAWLDIYGSLLVDDSLPPGIRAYLIGINEQSMDRQYLPCYRERYAARLKLLRKAASVHHDIILNAFRSIDTYSPARDTLDGFEERRLKGALLRVLIEADTEESHAAAEQHFRRAWHISDKVSALSGISLSGNPKRTALLNEAYDMWKDELNTYSSYLITIGSGIHDDVFDLIATEEQKDSFHIEHPTHSRALYLPMRSNNKMLWTERGLEWLAATVIKLTSVNEHTAMQLVDGLQLTAKLADDIKPIAIKALQKIHDTVDEKKYPSVSGRVKTYLGIV